MYVIKYRLPNIQLTQACKNEENRIYDVGAPGSKMLHRLRYKNKAFLKTWHGNVVVFHITYHCEKESILNKLQHLDL